MMREGEIGVLSLLATLTNHAFLSTEGNSCVLFVPLPYGFAIVATMETQGQGLPSICAEIQHPLLPSIVLPVALLHTGDFAISVGRGEALLGIIENNTRPED